jgi:hypothetical protein
MMTPYEEVSVHLPSKALLETKTPLLAGQGIVSDFYDSVDLLRSFQGSHGVSGTTFTVDPSWGDHRYALYFMMAVNTSVPDNQAPPGVLTFFFWPVDPTNVGNSMIGAGETVSLPLMGPRASIGDFVNNVFHLAGGVSGRVRARGRFVQVNYENGPVNQTDFALGVYLRPT